MVQAKHLFILSRCGCISKSSVVFKEAVLFCDGGKDSILISTASAGGISTGLSSVHTRLGVGDDFQREKIALFFVAILISSILFFLHKAI
jgi:hypothetical protein